MIRRETLIYRIQGLSDFSTHFFFLHYEKLDRLYSFNNSTISSTTQSILLAITWSPLTGTWLTLFSSNWSPLTKLGFLGIIAKQTWFLFTSFSNCFPLTIQILIVVPLTSFGLSIKDNNVCFFPFTQRVYWFNLPSCATCLSYCQGLPNKIWQQSMGIISHKTSST